VALLSGPAYRLPGNPFDEGLLLAYPTQLLDGGVPHRDFESFYGPGNVWLLAGIYELASPTQAIERTVGLGYQMAVVLALFVACLPWGRHAAVAAAVPAALLLLPFGLKALAAVGALALGLLSLAAASRGALREPEDVSGERAFLLAGLLAGGAGLFRLDFEPAFVLAALPVLAGASPPARRRYAVGLAAGALAYLVHAAIVGADKIGRVVSDLVASTGGRKLPVDFTDSEPGRMMLLALVALFLSLVLTTQGWRADGWDPRRRIAAALSLVSLALLPYAFSRLDYEHAALAAIPALALVPVMAADLGSRFGRAALAGGPLAAVGIVLLLLALAPDAVRGRAREHFDVLLSRTDDGSELLRLGERSFRVGAGVDARHARRVVAAAEAQRRDGAKTLFVGPRDLRRSNANDAFLYYLLDDLEPASYYMELNPQTANRDGSGLAGEVRRADLLILNGRWDQWDEPNESRRYGPNEPNRVAARHFCRELRAGTYEVLRRCR
jgi:hypothetical protein